ncbi:MAG TPA: hypothetical protein VJO72_11360 [Candidatus Dormibacteraeota bacterium]|nr:hypothetical protein [Candidatus Dormibacteraeota bacterium]
MGEPAPLQPDLPFDLEPPAPAPRSPKPAEAAATPVPTEPPSQPAWRPTVVEPPGPPLTQRILGRVRGLPWARGRALAGRALRGSRGIGALAGRALGGSRGIGAPAGRALRAGASVAGTLIIRGAPYAIALARNIARAGLVKAALRMAALAIHICGFPAVVTRTAIQLTVVHRAGLEVESVTYFETRDPAGYVIYQAPAELRTGLTAAFVPTAVLAALAILCLAPALTPRFILHLHPNLLTWLEIWLGLGFAAHALPSYDEAAPLAEQARAGLGKADPLALLTVMPSYLVAWLTRFGAVPPAALGIAGALWASRAIFH